MNEYDTILKDLILDLIDIYSDCNDSDEVSECDYTDKVIDALEIALKKIKKLN